MQNKKVIGTKLINSILTVLISLILSYVIIVFMSFGLTFWHGVYLSVYTLCFGLVGFFLMVLIDLCFQGFRKIYFVVGAVAINILIAVSYYYINQKLISNSPKCLAGLDLEDLLFATIVTIIISVTYFTLNKGLEKTVKDFV